MNKVELLDKIIELRHIQTLISNFIDVECESDGRIRTNFSLVETGRLSSHEDELGEGTHLQNVPLELRKMFIADSGRVFVEADKSQGEARIVAWLAHEERMKKAFLSGKDIHQLNADTMGSDRQFAKTRTHGWNYCKGVNRKMPKSPSTEDIARRKYFDLYPRILIWHDEVKWEVAKYRKLTNPFKRSRYFFDRIQWEFDEKHKPVNIVINDTIREAIAWLGQSTLVDDVNRGLVELFYKGEPRLEIIMQGHDSILVQCKPEDVTWTIEVMKKCLERPFWCGGDLLTIPVEFKMGESWGELKDVKNSGS